MIIATGTPEEFAVGSKMLELRDQAKKKRRKPKPKRPAVSIPKAKLWDKYSFGEYSASVYKGQVARMDRDGFYRAVREIQKLYEEGKKP